jgi:hypothetical protein
MPEEAAVLQGMIERQFLIERLYGMEINVERTKVMRISRQPSPIQIVIDQKHLKNYLGRVKTNDARCIREIESRTAMSKAAFNKKKILFYQQIGLKEETSKVLLLEHSFVWC